MKKPTKKDLKRAEIDYSTALIRWGENNQTTVRAMIKLYEIREQMKGEKNENTT